jgi:hypothetical protein
MNGGWNEGVWGTVQAAQAPMMMWFFATVA